MPAARTALPRTPRGPALVAAVVVMLALVGGCADDDATSKAAGSDSSAAARTTDPAPSGSSPADGPASSGAVVPDVLRFEAETVSGDSFSGASVAGKPVVVWFWAPWCSVCKSQAPEVTALADEYGDRVAFLGVGSLDSADAIESFADDVSGPLHLSDPDGDLYMRFGIAEQSSFVVLDATGDEVLRTGYADDDDLADTVERLAS